MKNDLLGSRRMDIPSSSRGTTSNASNNANLFTFCGSTRRSRRGEWRNGIRHGSKERSVMQHKGGEKIKKMKNGETKKKFYEVCFVDRGGMGRGGEVRIVD